ILIVLIEEVLIVDVEEEDVRHR
ncbi:hypothetical protein LCGC14_3093800, partial [marine sediment metagenome]